MNVRVVISRAGWRHKLHLRRAPEGGLTATLATRGGCPLGVAIATKNPSLDAAVLAAPQLYADLERMRADAGPLSEFLAQRAQDNSSPTTTTKPAAPKATEPTTAARAENLPAQAGTATGTGSPALSGT